MFRATALLAVASVFIPLAFADSVPEWGQCGGEDYTGSTTCVSPYVCDEVSPEYFQCIPGTESAPTPPPAPPTSPTGPSAPTPDTSNPYYNRPVWPSVLYWTEFLRDPNIASYGNLATSMLTIPTFLWLNQTANIPAFTAELANAGPSHAVVQIVLYNMPDRNCASASQPGEFTFANDGKNQYFSFVDSIVTQIQDYPAMVTVILEPNSLSQLVAHYSTPACEAFHQGYLDCLQYAIEQLSAIPQVYLYIDAGNAALIGVPERPELASIINSLYESSGAPSAVRGLATNVGNYNALVASTRDPIFVGDPVYDELQYAEALAPMLAMAPHFIVDQSRAGRQDIRESRNDWCNVNNAGFGTRPTYNTPSALIDAIVWVKPGGESDGVSDADSAEYDPACAAGDALQPAPQYGAWDVNYFASLVHNANPSF